uniref:Glutathione S-transferase o1 n=1 Tax=Lissorhoptrus oryzophilus TaxID=308863 RepID=A0A2R4FXI6_9CUCU|nr:glutathione S-transferase o1 [Lissorhoptrus oryzophilus]
MSSKHLGPGSVEPPRDPGLLRIYSMLYCPFAKRVRLVAKAKNLPHDIVNINLQDKPEWYLKINSQGLVPTLLDGEKLIPESLDISDYLDEKYPTENPLYPSDSEAKQKDKQIIQLIGPAVGNMFKYLRSTENYDPEELINFLLPPVQPIEEELASRKTKYFGGDHPGMIDYMLWPFAEITTVIPLKLGQKLPLQDNQLPNLRKWVKTISKEPLIRELSIPPEVFWKIWQQKCFEGRVDYESINNSL